MHAVSDEIRYRILKVLAENPTASQRELAGALNISVGKVNYCLKALINKGWLKASNFKNSRKKMAYMYLLTRAGIQEKVKLTYAFWRVKMREYERLTGEIDSLSAELREINRRASHRLPRT